LKRILALTILGVLCVSMFSMTMIPLVRSQTGFELQQLTTGPMIDAFPSIMEDNSGKIWLVWASGSQDALDLVCKTSEDHGVSWTEPRILMSNIGSGYGTSIFQDSTGKIWIVWSEVSRIRCISSVDCGNSWSEPEVLFQGSDEITPSIIEVSNTIWVIWRSVTSRYDVVYIKSSDSGNTWSTPVAIVSNTQFQTTPDAMVDHTGKIWIVWARGTAGADQDLFYITSADKGASWSVEHQLTSEPFIEAFPSLIEDSAGKIYLFYSFYPGTTDILYKTTTDSGQSWSASMELIADAYNDDCPCAALVDNVVWIVWHSDRSGNMDIWLTRLSVCTWDYVFEDCRKGTVLRISTDDKYFQFIAPDKDFGVKHDANMKILRNIIVICYQDNQMHLVATADCRIDFCLAIALDKQTNKYYQLFDPPNWSRNWIL
jgi:hypothetical protein